MDSRSGDDEHELVWVNEVNVKETDKYKTDVMQQEADSKDGLMKKETR